MKDLTDEQLMMLINKGDIQMMQSLFERYHIRIYNYCLKLTKNRAVSEDITQDTFYKIIKYRKSFKDKTFAAWIFTITRNLCIDHLKKNKSSALNTVSLEDKQETNSYENDDKNEAIEQLKISLNKLGTLDRELIILSRYEKLKYKDIANIVKISESAVKTRIHRALQKLKLYYFKLN